MECNIKRPIYHISFVSEGGKIRLLMQNYIRLNPKTDNKKFSVIDL